MFIEVEDTSELLNTAAAQNGHHSVMTDLPVPSEIHSTITSELASELVPEMGEELYVLIAAQSFGEAYQFAQALEADNYVPNFRMVFHHEHLFAALAAEEWDVLICSDKADFFDVRSVLLSIAAEPKIAPHQCFIAVSSDCPPEDVADYCKLGASDVFRHGNTERLRTTLRNRRRIGQITSLAPRESDIKNDLPNSPENTTESLIRTTENSIASRIAIDSSIIQLFEHSQDMIALLDAEGRFLYLSPSYFRNFGFAPTDVQGKNAFGFVHPDDIDKMKELFANLILTAEAQEYSTFRFLKADGDYLLLEGVATNHLQNPAIRAVVVNTRDISDRSGMEGALRESELQYKKLVDNLSEGIIITDADDRFVFANPAAEQTFGTESGGLVGRSIADFVKPETMALVDAQNAERRKGLPGRYELEIIRPNGTKRWQTINSSPRFDENGVFTGAFVIFNDITERKNNEEANVLFSQFLERRISERTEALKRANAELKHEIAERKRIEEMLLQSGERLNSLLKNSFDVITIVEENGDISYESPASEKVFGFDAFERIGKNFLHRIHPDFQEAARNFLRDVVNQTEHIRSVEVLHQSDIKHDYEWIEITASNQLHNPAVAGIVLNSREIAERKIAEQELKKSLQQEKELNDLKSRFITMVSHEFRTPLTVINSSAEILHLAAGKMPAEKQIQHIERMMASTGRIEQMLNDVLVLARGEAGKTRAVLAPLALKEFTEEIVSELTAASGKASRIFFMYGSSVRQDPWLDEKLMRSIITNLLSNALKYSSDEIEIQIDCLPDTISLRVSDKGIGIPADDQKHLFEAFHRAHNAINIKGTGIGMSIVKYAVDAHHGSISFKSVENEGTTFFVSLPFLTHPVEPVIDRS